MIVLLMGQPRCWGRLLLALLVFSSGQYPSCHGNGGHGGTVPSGETAGGGKCMEREREALLAVRDDVLAGATDRDLQRLPSWKRDGDCCRWKGVACDHRSGHVVKLDLRYYQYYWDAPGNSKVNPSLLNLGSLRYLDLSGNDFFGSPLPGFIGSLVNLEYLYINNTHFAGSVPLELGNLRNLKSLDLSFGFSYDTKVENLRWLSHLSHLQYLGMSGLNLSAAHDWLQVISMLPSLSVLHLPNCELPINPPNIVQIPLGNFTSLSTLNLGTSNLAYSTWSLWLSNISSLTTLVLDNRLNYTIPPEAFKNMKHLEVLTIEGGFTGLIPRSLWRLDKLKTLDLSGDDLRIGSSEDMGHLSSLRELSLSGVVGRFPDSLGNIMGLQSLRISTQTDHVTNIELPKSIGNLSRLEHLEVRAASNAMGGWLPESTGKLVGLKTLKVFGFNTSGEVLGNMGDLCNLTELDIFGGIERNKADGAEVTKLLEGLSECIGGSALEQLKLSGNGYRGHLPDQIGKLKNLWYVDLSHNSIDGSIPASIGELESLTDLYLSRNQLSGSIPSSIGELESLKHLDLSHNQLSGLVPSNTGKLSKLTFMDLTSNRLEGDLSEAHFSHLSQLDYMTLSNNAALSLNTSQTWIPPFQLSLFDMSACHVGPEFPKWLQTQKKLYWLDLSSNNISGSTVEDDLFNNLSSSYFNLSHNDIKGGIPSSICQIKSLEVLDLSYNHFSGQIPDCWRGGGLVAMDFSSNSLVGHIPSSIGMLSNLRRLHLDKNALTGSIPPSLKKCTMLKVLDLSQNNLSGEIPSWLGQSLSSLRILRLRSNMFHGYLPMSLSGLQSLKILDLAYNNLSGSILLSFHNLTRMVNIEKDGHASFEYSIGLGSIEKRSIAPKGTELEYITNLPFVTMIDLSSNNFSGQFPREVTNLQGLRFLNLSKNHLNGRIPENISTMGLLESLDLSFNWLIGRVPSSMSTMTSLGVFNVSYNFLSGRIPSGQIQTFDNYSFVGNLDLCGLPILGPCPEDATFPGTDQTGAGGFDASHDEHESHMAWFYASLGPGFVTGFLGFLGVFSLMRRSWRIAYFRFFDSLGDTMYVFVVVRYARLKVKLSAWRGGGSSG